VSCPWSSSYTPEAVAIGAIGTAFMGEAAIG